MTVEELRELLEAVEDSREIVVHEGQAGSTATHSNRVGGLMAVWRAARSEANAAYGEWDREATPESYAAYRAAEDRADAAEEMLSAVASQSANTA